MSLEAAFSSRGPEIPIDEWIAFADAATTKLGSIRLQLEEGSGATPIPFEGLRCMGFNFDPHRPYQSPFPQYSVKSFPPTEMCSILFAPKKVL